VHDDGRQLASGRRDDRHRRVAGVRAKLEHPHRRLVIEIPIQLHRRQLRRRELLLGHAERERLGDTERNFRLGGGDGTGGREGDRETKHKQLELVLHGKDVSGGGS
jgi:hypothetical protein